jgi:hypothetical protein
VVPAKLFFASCARQPDHGAVIARKDVQVVDVEPAVLARQRCIEMVRHVAAPPN